MAERTIEALAAPPEIVYELAPAAAVELAAAQALAYEVTDPVLAELARLRMGQLLGDEQGSSRRSAAARKRGLTEDKIAELTQWPTSDKFSPRERACLALAEQYVIDVSAVTDQDTAAVLEHLGPAGLYGFVQALYVIDESIRLDVALNAALPPSEKDQ